MYYGKVVEMTSSDELFKNPMHPYTRSLLSAIPKPNPRTEKTRKRISYNQKMHDYSIDKPELREVKPGHIVYCNEKEFAEYKAKLED
jgi:oligopeptide transport system ATP-binding protein